MGSTSSAAAPPGAGRKAPRGNRRRFFLVQSLSTIHFAAIALLVFGAGAALSYRLALLQHETDAGRRRDRVTLQMDAIRNNLSRELYANINLTSGLVDLVRIQGGINRSQFEDMARELTSHSGLIREVALAPGNVIRYIYPLAGNEKALGLDYGKTPEQLGAVRRAIAGKETVVAGPVDLAQGGVGIIGRTPIFIPSAGADSSGDYWGIASTVIDFKILVRATGIGAAEADLAVALRGRDGTGAGGAVFWGEEAVFNSAPVVLDIPLPSGSWRMAAVPRGGWPPFRPFGSVWFEAGLLLSAFLAILFFQILRVTRSRADEITLRRTTEADLRRTNRELERARGELEERVDRRTRELVIARDAAESADRLKSAFLANMSHELRTPLNSIIGFTGIILQGLVGDINAEQRKQLAMVSESAHHLLALINDVLDISKIEAGQLELRPETYPLRRSIEKAIRYVRPLAEKKSLSVAAVVDPAVTTVRGDPRRVEQVLINLLANAVKFTEAGGITVTVSGADGDAVRIAVRDTGIGIRAEDLPQLFQPFRQLDIGTTRRHEGTGLGLSICRKLAGLLGGEVTAASDGPGRGSTFTFTLPKGAREHGAHSPD